MTRDRPWYWKSPYPEILGIVIGFALFWLAKGERPSAWLLVTSLVCLAVIYALVFVWRGR